MKAKEDPCAPYTTNMVWGTLPNRVKTLKNTPLVNAGAECRNPPKKTAKTYGNRRKHAPNTPNLATKRPQRESRVWGQRSELSKTTLQYVWAWRGPLFRGDSMPNSVPRTSPPLHMKHPVQKGVQRPVGRKESPFKKSEKRQNLLRGCSLQG